MPRKAQVRRSAEETFAIVIEGLKSGNIAETWRNRNIAATLFYSWKEDVKKAAVAALGEEMPRYDLTKNRASASASWSVAWARRTCRLTY
jgi:hypothetical protein